MALTINTNISSMIVQSNLSKATNSLNKAIERMTTGYKINSASDNAAGYSIATNWKTKLGSLDVAADNAATGADMLSTLEDTYSLITGHLQRVRDLTEQAANGTYGADSLNAVKSEITARLDEIDRIAANCEYNDKHMMNGSITADINLQVGLTNDANSKITLSSTLFASAKVGALFKKAGATGVDGSTAKETEDKATVANLCVGSNAAATLTKIDDVIKDISGRQTTLGAAQNRVESAIESIGVQVQNITSSLSTLRDADVATESSNYIKAQILQQASATLLATANQTPSIALNLL